MVLETCSFSVERDIMPKMCKLLLIKRDRALAPLIQCRDGGYDGTAFKVSEFYVLPLEKRDTSKWLRLYILGDYVYALMSFFIAFYNNTKYGTACDNYKFFQYVCYIYVECDLGEIDSQWSSFWKPLRFLLENNFGFIDTSLRFHNFIVECKLDYSKRKCIH